MSDSIKKYKLNIGAGEKRIDGFINIDYDKKCNPDYVIDLEKDKLPFDDNSVEVVLARHVLEHLGDGFFFFIKELYRVCDNNAIIEIVVPHHRHDYFLNDPTHKRPITVEGLNMFSKKFNDYCSSINDGTSKLGYFFDVDFEIINYNYKFSPDYDEYIIKAKKGDTISQNLLNKYIKDRNNVIMETEVTWKTIKS